VLITFPSFLTTDNMYGERNAGNISRR
jgi:hypothetical protein